MTDTLGNERNESVISAYISRELVSEPQSIILENDTPLLESRILDSLSLLKLVLFLEKQFGITVGGDELVPDNFATIDAICKYVNSKKVTKGKQLRP